MAVIRNKKPGKVVVAVSGGFDPIHPGHVRLFKHARSLGDRLVVILNNDNWLMKKKNFVFMDEKQRKEVLKGIRYVDEVIVSKHPRNPSDMSVCRELSSLKPHVFANGGDRDRKDANKSSSSLNPEQLLCKKLGIAMAFNVGKGGKIESSSWLLQKFLRSRSL